MIEYDDTPATEQYFHTEHVFMSAEDAIDMAKYMSQKDGVYCKPICLYDHEGGWAVLRYDKRLHPESVVLLSDYQIEDRG